VNSGYTTPNPVYQTTYCDDDFRVCRDQDDKTCIYSRISDDPAPREFEDVKSDMGVSDLLSSALKIFNL